MNNGDKDELNKLEKVYDELVNRMAVVIRMMKDIKGKKTGISCVFIFAQDEGFSKKVMAQFTNDENPMPALSDIRNSLSSKVPSETKDIRVRHVIDELDAKGKGLNEEE